ncbi:MAG: type II toxin-antitoxin system RelE/ParE family toxin [Alteromonadaceae bacterium]|nr:type II toxin-antitoxin system RelE/ParE family toxin [Alteromonadaceae bacterium]
MTTLTWKASLEAKTDIQEIALYTKQKWGRKQKNSYLKTIKLTFEKITNNPLIGRKRKDLAKNLFSIPSGEHIIFYQLDLKHVYTRNHSKCRF